LGRDARPFLIQGNKTGCDTRKSASATGLLPVVLSAPAEQSGRRKGNSNVARFGRQAPVKRCLARIAEGDLRGPASQRKLRREKIKKADSSSLRRFPAGFAPRNDKPRN